MGTPNREVAGTSVGSVVKAKGSFSKKFCGRGSGDRGGAGGAAGSSPMSVMQFILLYCKYRRLLVFVLSILSSTLGVDQVVFANCVVSFFAIRQ